MDHLCLLSKRDLCKFLLHNSAAFLPIHTCLFLNVFSVLVDISTCVSFNLVLFLDDKKIKTLVIN